MVSHFCLKNLKTTSSVETLYNNLYSGVLHHTVLCLFKSVVLVLRLQDCSLVVRVSLWTWRHYLLRHCLVDTLFYHQLFNLLFHSKILIRYKYLV